MAKVRQRNTGPELVVRRVAHRLGLRFRLHRRDLPGSPDIVFVRARAAVFVHGCFWHRHQDCAKSTMPKSNYEFWATKFATNVRRDRLAIDALERMGWRVLTIWQCETEDETLVETRLLEFLS
jgi:DNA mismatch endonuclease, patch repair protein